MSRTFFFIAFFALVALALTPAATEAAIPTDKRPRHRGLGFPPADAPGPNQLYDCHFHGHGMPGGMPSHFPGHPGAPEESHHHGFFPGHFPGYPGEPGHYNHHNGGHFFGDGKPLPPAEAPYMPPRH